MKLLDILTAPWAIEPGKLLEIQAIYLAHARGEKADLAAIEARLGRPLANEPKPYTIDQGVAILPIEGVIAKRANMFMDISGGVSTELLGRDLRAALQDPQVHSIILAIDSPGGSVDGTQALAAQIRAGAQQKPIVTLASGTIASAAYWLGSAASAVYIADGTTISGSIGVVASHTDYSKARSDRGITVTEITAGKYKRIASDNAPLTKEGKQYLQDQVDYYYSLFVNSVASHRGTTAECVLRDMADGKVWIGQQGIDAGLIDAIQTMPQLVASLNADYAASLADSTYERGAHLARANRAAPKSIISPVAKKGAAHMNREQLAAEHPALVDAILAEGRTNGAAAERERILAIESAAIPGHEALVAKLKADGTTSAGDAALQIMAAEKQLRVQADGQRQAEAPAPLVLVPRATVSPTPAEAAALSDAALSVEDRCKATWDKDAAVRAEFSTLGAFKAYTQAFERGAVKLLAKKSA